MKLLLMCVAIQLAGSARAAGLVVTVDPLADNHPISPLAFGGNEDYGTGFFKNVSSPAHDSIPEALFMRMSGNRFSAFNWEISASNSGKDWGPHSNDFAMLPWVGLPPDDKQAPAAAVTGRMDRWRLRGQQVMVSLQTMGPVAADGNGLVTKAQAAPGLRWKQALPAKGAPFSLPPDLKDDSVFMDEYVHFLVKKYGPADKGGIRYYSIDNEPGLWHETHPFAHPEKARYSEVTQKSVALALAVTKVDPGAELFGPVSYAYQDYRNLSDAPDAASYKARYPWFVDYYMDEMKKASTKAGRRLLHYLDVHYYPEARGKDGVRVLYDSKAKSEGRACAEARMQAPRSLWDPHYIEGSWVNNDLGKQPLRLIPRLREHVAKWYPGTKLSISEYSFGGAWDISGGIAQADLLGILVREDVAGNYWQHDFDQDEAYVRAAFQLWLNYDGKGSRVGDISAQARVDDLSTGSAYAVRSSKDKSRLWVLVLNKSYDQATPMQALLKLPAGQGVKALRAWRFDPSSPKLREVKGAQAEGAGLKDSLPARSATVYELRVL